MITINYKEISTIKQWKNIKFYTIHMKGKSLCPRQRHINEMLCSQLLFLSWCFHEKESGKIKINKSIEEHKNNN